MDFNNNVVPNNIYGNNIDRFHTNDIFHYEENINSLYINYSKTFFKKNSETRIGFRYENIVYKMREDVSATSRKDSYGTLLPNLLLKYSFSENYDLSLTYNRNLWRPWYTEFNPFLVPTNEGTFSRGNMGFGTEPKSQALYEVRI